MSSQVFEYHPKAILEAYRSYHWYDDRSENAADGFWQELLKARHAVTQDPRTWSSYLHGTRCYQSERYPFALVYVERNERIVGIAIAHLLRRPGYWRSRLDD